ncbi:UNVERIFIED_ORG: L-alanine-DL-glutamate epimerase-like enolase superfamily enzyme [Pseudomonas vranovensis]|nr:L-alanine-DL-glutamate epimerase-like enolase superfamily enzyme [Pseudomonas vranovensis]
MSHPLIERISTLIVDLPTIRPHKLAMHTMQQQTLVIIRLQCSDGIEGLGEATTIGGLAYGNESPESIKQNIDSYFAPLLVGLDASNINAAMQRLDKVIKGNTFARSGIESALLDAQGKRQGLAVSELLRRARARQPGSGLDPGQRRHRARHCRGPADARPAPPPDLQAEDRCQ